MWLSAGNTRSGKTIYMTMRVELIEELFDGPHKDFREYDLFDTYAVYEFLISRSSDRGEDTYLWFSHSKSIYDFLGPEKIWKIADTLNLKTSLDIARFGKSLVAVEFRDP